jgi:5-methylcytosine-specific restriction protein A
MTVCTEPSCTELVPASRSYTKCEAHAPVAWANTSARNRNRPANANALRAMARRRDRYRCVRCGARGIEVDHVTPVSAGGGWTLDNLQTLCTPCHESKTLRERRGA